MIQDDGDIVRGLGFVTMHASHLEGRIEDLLTILSSISPYSPAEQKWPISKKVRKCIKVLRTIPGTVSSEIIADLEQCLSHFEWRNELVHGRVYSPKYKKENLKSARPNVPDRKVRSHELYMLANNLVELNARIYRPMLFALPRELRKLGK
jgi:hypothetical protein